MDDSKKNEIKNLIICMVYKFIIISEVFLEIF